MYLINIYCRLPKLGISNHVFKISLCYNEKWEIKLCISVNIYCRLLKLGISTHVFKITLCNDEKWEIKLCISVNIYHRLPKLGISTHVFKISLCVTSAVFESKDEPTQMTKQSFTIIYFITYKKTIHFKLICKNVHS